MTLTKLLAFAVLAALIGCGGRPPAESSADALSAPLSVPEPGAVVARVDGVAIHEAWLKTIARGRNLDLADPAQRTRALDELIEYAVLLGAARKQPDLSGNEARSEIELNALAARANAILSRVGASADPDEATLRAEYDKQRQLNGELEYEVTHLLFADETVAIEAAGAVLGGQDFAAVQVAYKDKARQAVELGWIKLGQVPAEFATALRGLQSGQTTPVPVHTSYGWHVIHLRATRAFTSPPFEQVREGIRRMLVAEASRAAVEALKSQAKIDIVRP